MILLKTNILYNIALALASHGLQVDGRDILSFPHKIGGASGVNQPAAEGNDANGAPGSEISRHLQFIELPTYTPTPHPSSDTLSAATGPWDINFIDLSADFSVDSNEELVLNYEIGMGRQFDTFLFMKDCATNVTDITINHTEPLVNNSPPEGSGPSPFPSSFGGSGFPPSPPPSLLPTPSSFGGSGFPPSPPPSSGFPPSPSPSLLPTPGFPPSPNPTSGFPPSPSPSLLPTPSSFGGSGFPPSPNPTSGFPPLPPDENRGRAMQGVADTLTLGYDIDKSMIANSSIWNATSSQIELCQVVQLKEGTLVITEDKRQVSIAFDLSVDYEVSDIALGAETINAGNDTVDASSYIEACKCDGVSFVCNTDDLVPNSELIVCIKSISPDLEIDFLDTMNITQGEQDMAVVSNQAVVFTSFTSVEYVSAENGVVVSTRAPANVFDYNTVGSVIGINGGLVMKLPGSGRNLQTDIGAKLDANEEASFEIEVTLQRELGFVEETSSNSAANVASGKGVIGSVMVLACAYAMMW